MSNMARLFRITGLDNSGEDMASVARELSGFQCPILRSGSPNRNLTQEALEIIADTLLSMGTRRQATSSAGVAWSDFKRWMVKGEQDASEGILSNEWMLWVTVANAEQVMINLMTGVVANAALTDWRAAAKLLERYDKQTTVVDDFEDAEVEDKERRRTALLESIPEYALEDNGDPVFVPEDEYVEDAEEVAYGYDDEDEEAEEAE